MADAPKCPQCGSEMKLREGSRGKFYGCSTFPKCKGTKEYDGEQEKCPKCGSMMVLKNGKNGRFYSCSKYPECRETKDYKEVCPKCGSDMQKKQGPNGDFLSCVKYPECKGTRNIGLRKDGTAGTPAKAVNIEDTTDYSKDENPF
ncbi:MAG: topoisomerase DNA-binding C4 zinc finger domain-containing protein [Spirochaetia bacterium]|nr:topoisomerase DNA-binding C4 zinc finger domain-containing protein [Spirochaetia bacterium]